MKTTKRTLKVEHIVYRDGNEAWRKQVRFTNGNGESKRKWIYGSTETECLRNAEIFKKNSGKLDLKTITLLQALNGYVADKGFSLKAGSLVTYRSLIKKVERSFRTLRLEQLDKRKMNAIISSIYADGCRTSTVKLYLKLIRAACNYYDHKNVPTNKELSFRKEEKKEKEYPSFREMERFVTNTNCEVPALLSLYCGGMRINEVLGLQYSDFYERDGACYVHIHRGRTCVNGREIIQETLKTPESTRTVKVPDWLYRKVLDQPHESKEEFIFPHRPETLQRRFKKVVAENGYDLTFHSLRHIFAVSLMKANVMLNVIARLGGWEQGSKVLMGIYLKASQKDVDEEMVKFDQYLAARPD